MKGEIGLLLLVLLPMLGGLVSRMLNGAGERSRHKGWLRGGEVLFFGITALTLVTAIIYGVYAQNGHEVALSIPEICGRGIGFRMEGFRVVYVILAAFAWTVSSLFALWYTKGEENRGRYYFYTLLTLGATLGVFLSVDLYTTFIFFEIMSLASYVWVIQEEDAEAVRASQTYLAVAIIGGLVMLMGIFMIYNSFGTLQYDELTNLSAAASDKTVLYAAGFCLLFGFGAKAGSFPLHIWLPKAHPVAPAPASALLSGILTKAGMYGVLLLTGRLFLGDVLFGQILLFLAVCTMLVGAVLALFSIDMKHILACSSVSQIGFMLVGAGAMCILEEEQWLAVQGAILHMVNHSLFKLVLFLLAGVIVKNLESRDLNVIRGFGVGKPWFMALYLCAALGIAGIPGFSGFVSKSMLHEAIVLCYHESGMIVYKVAEILFLIAGGCTLAYMLKLFMVLFVAKPSKEVQSFNRKHKTYLPIAMKLALSIPAALIVILGSFPKDTMSRIAATAASITAYEEAPEAFEVFTLENMKGGLISVCIGLLLYWCFVRIVITKKVSAKETRYVNRFPKRLDMENLIYRPILMGFLLGLCKKLFGLLDKLTEMLVTAVRRTILKPVCETTSVPLSRAIANVIGRICNGIAGFARKFSHKHQGAGKDYVESVNRGFDDVSETVKLVSRSLSYGLLTFCVGLLTMVLYLLYCLRG